MMKLILFFFATLLVTAQAGQVGQLIPEGCDTAQEVGTYGDSSGGSSGPTFQRSFNLPGVPEDWSLDICVAAMKADSPGAKAAALKITSPDNGDEELGMCVGTFPEDAADSVGLENFEQNGAEVADWRRCSFEPVNNVPSACVNDSVYWGEWEGVNTTLVGTVDTWDLAGCIEEIQGAIDNQQFIFMEVTPIAAWVNKDGECRALSLSTEKGTWRPNQDLSCAVDFSGAGWNEWGPYEECGATNHNQKTRVRLCPLGSADECSGPSAETIGCGWGPWSEWSVCNVGQTSRSRVCSVEPPVDCPSFEATEALTCQWSEWGPYEDCNPATKTKIRRRTCPAGADCAGPDTDTATCGWDNWAEWGPCDEVDGIRNRTRTCLVQPADDDCPGISQESGECGWGPWGGQNPCQEGYKTTTRTCKGHPGCNGDTIPCDNDPSCIGQSFERVGCGYTPWGNWSLCVNEERSRQRLCTFPDPVDCDPDETVMTEPCNVQQIWGEWSGCNYDGDAYTGERERHLRCIGGPCPGNARLLDKTPCRLFCDDVMREYEYQACVQDHSECKLAADNAPYHAVTNSKADTCTCLQRILDCFVRSRCFKKDWCLARIDQLNGDLISGAATTGLTKCADLRCDADLRPMCEGHFGKLWLGVNERK